MIEDQKCEFCGYNLEDVGNDREGLQDPVLWCPECGALNGCRTDLEKKYAEYFANSKGDHLLRMLAIVFEMMRPKRDQFPASPEEIKLMRSRSSFIREFADGLDILYGTGKNEIKGVIEVSPAEPSS